MKCTHCGGSCQAIGNGKYECQFCGTIFSQEENTSLKMNDLTSVKGKDGVAIFEENINGVLEIVVKELQGGRVGSGYIISPQGYAITNAHVAANDDGKPCSHMLVNVCGQQVTATVIALADDKAGHGKGVDLALIRLEYMPAEAKALTLGDSNKVRNGEPVYVIGNSMGYGTCITSGIISDRNRGGRLMTDCAVNGGNSGGPILNTNGEVIGTITSQGRTHDGADAEGMNYAIPVNVVKQFLERCIRR